MTPLILVVPGPIDQRTGGYLYDARLLRELREAGRPVEVVELPGAYPQPDDDAVRQAEQRFQAFEDGALVMSDALAGSALPELMHAQAERLRLVALVHHPLALETGLSEARAAEAAERERRALAVARHVVCTSRSTAEALADYDVPADRITVAEPGTDLADIATGGARGEPFRLLCVATITARKGHAVLIESLARLRTRCPGLHWQLDLVGSLERSPPTVQTVRELIASHQLEAQVTLHGEASERMVNEAYAAADAFVLASFHEGYGMVLSEALARGLPIVATRGGAMADTVPAGAGLLVDVGDAQALSAALETIIGDAARRRQLRAGALAARDRLVSWRDTAQRVSAALDDVDDEVQA